MEDKARHGKPYLAERNTFMTYAWEDLEGVSLAGEYCLEQCLGSEPSGAFFLTSFGPERQRAVLKLVVEDPPTAGVQLALWQRTAGLDHPGLMALLDCGRTACGNDRFLYAAFQAPDDSLTAAVRYGPLSEEEARDVLASVAAALEYLHDRGWAHTSIDAEHVVAVGDRIKLASDTLRDATENQAAQSDDVWALVALLYERVTSRRIGPGEAADVSGISEPLRTIVSHAVEPDVRYRWTVAQMAQALDPGRASDVPAAIGVVQAVPAAEPWRADKPVAEEQPAGKPAPAVEPAAAAEPSPADVEFAVPDVEPRESAPRPPAISVHEPFTTIAGEEPAGEPAPPEEPPIITRYVSLAAVAAVALLAIVFVVAHHATPAPPALAIVPPPVAEPAARVIPTSAPKQLLPSWRVVAYTYSRHQDAEKKAESINTRFAGIHAEVFRAGSSYLISLGAHLTREEAATLQRKAIGKGLPRDTYIQNFRTDE